MDDGTPPRTTHGADNPKLTTEELSNAQKEVEKAKNNEIKAAADTTKTPETGNPSSMKPTANSTDMDMEIVEDNSDNDNDDKDDEEDGISPSNAGQNAATLVAHQ